MKGILVNYEYCTNCHSCEVACKKHLELEKGEFGIKINEVGPYQYSGKEGAPKDKWEWYYAPSLTKACDWCTDRTDMGKMPLCQQSCQAWCLYFGEIEELVTKIDEDTRWALLTKAQ